MKPHQKTEMRNYAIIGDLFRVSLDANLGMLTVGLAWWYRYYKDEQSERSGPHSSNNLAAKIRCSHCVVE